MTTKLLDTKSIRSILACFVALNLVLFGLYVSFLEPHLTKPFWEAFSLTCHGSAFVLCWIQYLRKRSDFMLWCSVCITALLIRDWHGFHIEGYSTLTSICYYIILVAAFGSGIPKINAIKKALSEQKILLLLWGTTFLFYASSYIYDRGLLKYISEAMKMYGRYIEEASEATGALLLLIAALIVVITNRPQSNG